MSSLPAALRAGLIFFSAPFRLLPGFPIRFFPLRACFNQPSDLFSSAPLLVSKWGPPFFPFEVWPGASSLSPPDSRVLPQPLWSFDLLHQEDTVFSPAGCPPGFRVVFLPLTGDPGQQFDFWYYCCHTKRFSPPPRRSFFIPHSRRLSPTPYTPLLAYPWQPNPFFFSHLAAGTPLFLSLFADARCLLTPPAVFDKNFLYFWLDVLGLPFRGPTPTALLRPNLKPSGFRHSVCPALPSPFSTDPSISKLGRSWRRILGGLRQPWRLFRSSPLLRALWCSGALFAPAIY